MIVCDTCGQTGLLLEPGVPCLRKYDDYKQTCFGTMVELETLMTPAERQALDRKRRKELGICRQCSELLDPKSVAFCTKHLEARRKHNVTTSIKKL
jgi:hypothetical protein